MNEVSDIGDYDRQSRNKPKLSKWEFCCRARQSGVSGNFSMGNNSLPTELLTSVS